MNHVLRTTCLAVAIAAGWLMLAGSVEVAEVVLAGIVGIGGALFGTRLRRFVGHEQTGWARWRRHLRGAVTGAYRDCWRCTVVLARALSGRPTRGRFRWRPAHVGGEHPDAVGRRVFLTLWVTLQPGSYVVAVDPDRDAMLVHELEPSPHGPIPDELRAGR